MTKTLTITGLSTNAEGIARADGKVIFVPFTLPGETWEVELIEEKKKYSRGHPQRMLAVDEGVSTQRIEPKCLYYTECGGCQMQHISYAAQLTIKQEWLRETFQRVGHLEIEPKPVVSCNEWDYRNKVTFALVEHDGFPALALHTINQPRLHIPVEDCMICDPLIRKAVPVIGEALKQSTIQLKPYRSPRQQGSRLVLRRVGSHIELKWVETHFKSRYEEWISVLQESIPELIVSNKKNKTDSFAQINEPVRDALYQYVRDISYQKYEKLLDGYCGTGELAQQMSDTFMHIDGVEINKYAVQDAKNKIQKEQRSKIHFHAQDVEVFLSHTNHKYDVMVLNPPRAGLSEAVRKRVAENHPHDVVMISCHPAALVRDTKELLAHGYTISSIQPFDMFPQTYHTETVVHYHL